MSESHVLLNHLARLRLAVECLCFGQSQIEWPRTVPEVTPKCNCVSLHVTSPVRCARL